MRAEPTSVFEAAQSVYRSAKLRRPPDDGTASGSQEVIPMAIVRSTRGYIEKTANQINGAYERGWYDACAVMMRKLLETVIIEAFETTGVEYKAQDANGEYLALDGLISAAMSEWTLSRDVKPALKILKKLGDRSAHSRRFVANRHDVDKLVDSFRISIQEFVHLAQWKSGTS